MFKAVNEGKEIMINLQKIYNWLLNNQDNSNSIYLLGYLNYYGIGININMKKSLELFQKAAKLENILAQLDVANRYLYDDNDKNKLIEAFEIYKKLAEREIPFSIVMLGCCHENGIGTEKNEKKAFNLFQKAAYLGNSFGLWKLGCCCIYEIGTSIINEQKAFESFQKSADLGHSCGIYDLGACYENGVGIEIDEEKAFELYQKAEDLENLYAIDALGCCYITGIGTDNIDMQKAFDLFQQAANLGNSSAQYNLAAMFEDGYGIKKDMNQAIYWYKKSAEQDYQNAKDRLMELQIV
ncbi:Skt5p [Rhizophagus irregularis DAOM 197198w]|uniref:Skt5p n=1 Tax=Rhizophagus irregularis (strain DAOM 197198w) TaxID=1432141 RepID=A0A015K8M5_RHIIW|nr:Skt5p [Rhizophagus irregularis DAOM 197198w]